MKKYLRLPSFGRFCLYPALALSFAFLAMTAYADDDRKYIPVSDYNRLLIQDRMILAATVGFLCLLLGGIIVMLYYRRRDQGKATILFQQLPQRIFIVDRKEQILYAHVPDPDGWLPSTSNIRLDQIQSKPVEEKLRAAIQKAFDCNEKVTLDLDINGQFRHDEFLRLPDNNPFHTEVVMCVSSNVTELHEAHLESRLMAERFRLTLESIGDGVITTDCEEKVTLLNPVAAAMTGYTPEEAKGKKLDEIFDIVSYVTGEKVESPLKRALAAGKTVELANHTDLIAKDGTRYHIADCASPIRDETGAISGGVLVFRDVTEEYEKRDQLRMNSAILKIVEQIGRIGYFRCTDAGEILHRVPEEYWPWRDGRPIPPEEWIAKPDLNTFTTEWQNLQEGKKDSLNISFSADKPRRYFALQAEKSVDEGPGRKEFCGVIQDITHSRENERRLHDNFQLLKNIMDNLPGYIFVKNADDNLRYLMGNRKFAEIIGVDSERVPGSFDSDLFPLDEEAAQKFREDDMSLVKAGGKLSLRERFVSANGQPLMTQTVKTVLSQSDGTRLLIGMGIDVSREYELEQQQKRTIESLERSTRSERTINQSLSMITVEPDFEKAVNAMLHIIGENGQADRAYIFLYHDQECRYAVNEYEWVQNPKDARAEKFRTIDMSEFPLWMKHLRQRQDILIRDMDTHPDELKAELDRVMPQAIKSLLVSGIWQNNRLLGFVGLDYIRKPHEFNENSVHMVRNIANLFLLARERAQQLERIAETTLLQKQIVDHISIPIAIIDMDFRFVTANPSLLQLLGKSWEELRDRKCYECLCGNPSPPDWCCRVCAGEKMESDSTSMDWNGRNFIINTQPVYDRNHKIRYLLKSVIDITDINRQKLELQKAMEQALAADRAKSYFLATMSHELRTPLNAVLGFSELLQNGEVSKEEQLDYLRSINCAGSALLNLINDVLDLSRLEADQTSIAPSLTNILELLNEMIAVFQLKAKQKDIALHLLPSDIRYPVYVDHLRIRQVLLNLVGNAIKFTRRGKVALQAGFTPSAEDGNTGELSIQVTDTGIGIPDDYRKRIFDPFVQVETTRGNRTSEGSGLGLTICMRLVERMGGTIEVDSKPGEGSTFTVKLSNIRYERQEISDAPSDPTPLPPPLPERWRVLVVDDVPMNLKVLAAMLRKLNIDCVCAESGMQALKILRTDKDFNCILTDLWMPEMNGEQLIDAILTMPGTGKMKIIAVTADTEVKNSFSEEKFDEVLSKPVTLETLQKMFLRIRYAL